MQAQRMFLHVLAVTALSACCMAQGMQAPGAGNNQRFPGTSQQQIPANQGQIDPNMPPSMSHDTSMKSPDQDFIMKAAQGGLAEVKLGNIAKQNGGNDAVKQFGDKMVSDHSQANDQLRQLAQQKGISLPSNPSMKDRRLSKSLAAKHGADFDKAYIHDMVKDHEQDVAEFRQEAENGKDPDVKAWAQKTLPTLEQHLANAKQIASQVGVDTPKKSAAAMSSSQ